MLYLVIRLSDKKIVAVVELRDLADMIADAFPVPCGVYNYSIPFVSTQSLNDFFNLEEIFSKPLDKSIQM